MRWLVRAGELMRIMVAAATIADFTRGIAKW
jgi:hypothetical protein